MEADDASTLRRELPRRKLAIAFTIVLVNVAVVMLLRGHAIALRRPILCIGQDTCYYRAPRPDEVAERPWFACVPPWKWTADEWRETLLRR